MLMLLVTAFAFNQPAAHEDEPGVGTLETRSDAERGRFATAGLSEQAPSPTSATMTKCAFLITSPLALDGCPIREGA